MTDEDILLRLTDPARLEALEAAQLLHRPPAKAYDRLTQLAVRLLGVPTALLSVIDDRRQFFVSAVGVGEPWASAREAPLSDSFCKFVAAGRDTLRIDDAQADPRLHTLGTVAQAGIGAYLGVPVFSAPAQGSAPERGRSPQPRVVLGAFCVIDPNVRQWSDDEVRILQDLADAAAEEIELRTQLRALQLAHQIHQVLIETLPATSVLIFDHELRYVSVEGTSFLSQFKLAQDRMVGQLAVDVAVPENRQALVTQFRAALAGQTTKRIATRAGRTVEQFAAPVRADDGRIVAGVAVARDVTETTQLRADLSDREAVLRALDTAFGGRLSVVDARGDSLLGREVGSGSVPGPVPPGFFLDEGASPCPPEETPLQQALAGKRTERDFFVRDSRSGGKRVGTWEHFTSAPLVDGDGRVFGAATFRRESGTERALAERLLAQTRHLALLERVGRAADLSVGLDAVVREALSEVAATTTWPLAHVYLRHGDVMAPSDVWISSDIDRYQAFVDVSMQTSFAQGEGVVGEVASTGELRFDPNLGADPAFKRASELRAAGLSSGLFLPVMFGKECLAVIEFFLLPESAPPSDELLEVLRQCGQVLAHVFEGERSRIALESAVDEVRALSLIDDATGLYNRRGFMTLAEQQLLLDRRTPMRHVLVSVALEKSSATVPEATAREVAAVLRKVFRESDVVARLGEGEFVAFAADASHEGSERILARLKAQLDMRDPSARLMPLVSVVAHDPAHPRSLDQLLLELDARANEARLAFRTRDP